MNYHSTKSPGRLVGLKEAVLHSLPPDNGLYMPERLPRLAEGPSDFWRDWRRRSFIDNSTTLARAFFGDDVPPGELERIVGEALSFDAPVVEPLDGRRVLELFHGPTLAFKDFGARFMARLMTWLARDDPGDLTVLVATSGDTGGAVADAFHRVEGVRVVILYPSGMVSGLQEKQLTTLGDNIEALEIDGSFDDCQRMVKAALLDGALARRLHLTSANSINIARLVPQCFYYIEAARQLPEGSEPVFVVPSGNLGNLTAGLLAARAGLPTGHFIAATNANDVVPRYLADGRYEPRPTIRTISNAMDVGAPSNFTRISELLGDDTDRMRSQITAFSFDDTATRAAIREVHAQCGYVLDPHGAVGWLAADAWRATRPDDPTVVLATAHPAKFPDVIEEELGPGAVETPERLARLSHREKHATPMPADEAAFRTWLSRH